MIFIFKRVMGSMLIFTGVVCLFRGHHGVNFSFTKAAWENPPLK